MAKPKPEHLPIWLTVRQVGDYLNASQDTVHSLIASGRLPAYQFGPRSMRVRLTDVDALLVPVDARPRDAS